MGIEIENRYRLTTKQFEQAKSQSTEVLLVDQCYVDTRISPLTLVMGKQKCSAVKIGEQLTVEIPQERQAEFAQLANIKISGARFRKTHNEKTKEDHYYFTLKGKAEGNAKPEFEVECTEAHFKQANSLAGVGLTKMRYIVPLEAGLKAEIDQFIVNKTGAALGEFPIIAEIEHAQGQPISLPDFISPESLLVESPNNLVLASVNGRNELGEAMRGMKTNSQQVAGKGA